MTPQIHLRCWGPKGRWNISHIRHRGPIKQMQKHYQMMCVSASVQYFLQTKKHNNKGGSASNDLFSAVSIIDPASDSYHCFLLGATLKGPGGRRKQLKCQLFAGTTLKTSNQLIEEALEEARLKFEKRFLWTKKAGVCLWNVCKGEDGTLKKKKETMDGDNQWTNKTFYCHLRSYAS